MAENALLGARSEELLYLLDANTLITANNQYYPIERIPQYWDWLIEKGEAGLVKIPVEIAEEVGTKSDAVGEWIRRKDVAEALRLKEPVHVPSFRRVMREGYSPSLDETQIQKLGRDPLLVAYGLAGPNRTIVTKEISKPKREPQNRKVPDACDALKLRWIDDFDFYSELDFRIR